MTDQQKPIPHSSAATGEPIAWICELAYAIDGDRQYCDWREHLSKVKPLVPEASIRNLRPLFTDEPQEVPVIGDDALWALASALHSNVPEDERPMSWSDFSPEQIDRIRLAAEAFLGKYTDSRMAPLAEPSAIDSPEVRSSSLRGTSSVSRPQSRTGES